MTDRSYDNLKRRNFAKELDGFLAQLVRDNKVPRLFLHSCCAPCSSAVLAYLTDYFKITVFYYNPNISDHTEYARRVSEQIRFIREFPAAYPVDFIEGDYDTNAFFQAVKGLEQCKEGGERCFACYGLRLRRTAQEAVRLGGYDYFTTTLSISPLKDSARLAQIGLQIGEEEGIPYLLSDFKKKDGFKRSVQLSAEYGLYRQNYCGCIFSKNES